MSEKLSCGGRARLSMWSHDAWKVAAATDPTERIREVDIRLEIQGDDGSGYHLVMTPDGCFTADNWYRSKREALEAASEMFGTLIDGWALEKQRYPAGLQWSGS